MKSILTHIKPDNLKADHFHNSKFPALLKFGKHKTINETLFSHFPKSELWMFCVPLTWQEQEDLGPKPISEPCSDHYIFASVSVGSWIVIFNYYLFTALTGQYVGSENS